MAWSNLCDNEDIHIMTMMPLMQWCCLCWWWWHRHMCSMNVNKHLTEIIQQQENEMRSDFKIQYRLALFIALTRQFQQLHWVFSLFCDVRTLNYTDRCTGDKKWKHSPRERCVQKAYNGYCQQRNGVWFVEELQRYIINRTFINWVKMVTCFWKKTTTRSSLFTTTCHFHHQRLRGRIPKLQYPIMWGPA